MSTSFYTVSELKDLGFRKIGDNVLISRKTSIYGAELMEIGNHVRIDDYCILSGNILLGSYIHISAYTALYGRFGIEIADFATISGRVLIYSQNDDYSGNYYTNPMVPELLTNVTGGRVIIQEHAIVGAGSIVMPNLCISEGTAVGALSFVNKSTEAWTIYAGSPAKAVKPRSKKLLELNTTDIFQFKPDL